MSVSMRAMAKIVSSAKGFFLSLGTFIPPVSLVMFDLATSEIPEIFVMVGIRASGILLTGFSLSLLKSA